MLTKVNKRKNKKNENCLNYNNKKLKKRAKKAVQKRGSLKDVRYKMTRMRRPCIVHSGFFLRVSQTIIFIKK